MAPQAAGDDAGVSLDRLALGLAVVSAVGLAAAAGALPPVFQRLAALPLVLFGVALPLVARLTPSAPPLLAALYSALLSPLLAGSLYLVLKLALPSQAALAGVFAAAALLSLTARGRLLPARDLGAADVWAALLAVALAGLVGSFVFHGNAPRVSYHGLRHAAVLLAVERSVPPENPWLAGTPLAYYWFYHGVGALLARALLLAPTQALALVNVWAALTLPVSLYAAAGARWPDARRALLGTALGVLGLNALGGWVWLAHGLSWDSPGGAPELLRLLARQVVFDAETARPLWDPRLAFGLDKFGNQTSYGAALAFVAGGLAAATRCVRDGRPGPAALCGLLHGGALLFNPVMGGVATLTTGLAALCYGADARARSTNVGALVLASLPGLALVALGGSARSGSLFSVGFRAAELWSVLAPLALLLPFALLALWRARAAGSAREQHAVPGLFALAAFVPALVYPFLDLPEANEYKLVRLAALPLGLLAGAGAVDALALPGRWRAAGALALGVLLVGVGASNALGVSAYLAFSRRALPLEEGPLWLRPARGELGRDARAAYDWLASAAADRSPAPVLVVNVDAPPPSYGPRHAPFRFITPHNLHGHEAPAFAGVDLWCDRESPLVESHPAWPARLAAVRALYGEPDWSPEARASLGVAGRPLWILVRAVDRAANPGLEMKLVRHGYGRVYQEGGVAIYAAEAGGG